MKNITLHDSWLIKANIAEVFNIISDFEKFPEYFPKVAESIHITKREGDSLEIEAVAKSFGQSFPVKMKTRIIPGKGYISDNESPKLGTSGYEELLLSEHPEGTIINYTYQITIHRRWLSIVAKPLIGWYSMKYWKGAVIDVLRKRLEK